MGNFKTGLMGFAGKAELKLKEKSPEILLAVGLISFVGAVVSAGRQTLKAKEVLQNHADDLEDIEEAREIAEKDPERYEYDLAAYERDTELSRLQTVGKVIKIYTPTAALTALSFVCILSARNIMQKRYLAVVAAYNGLSAVLDLVKQRVVDEGGEEMWRHYRYGTEYGQITETTLNEDGSKKKEKIATETTDVIKIPEDESCRVFDSSNINWQHIQNLNLTWLRGVRCMLNDTLQTRGHVFLNEVYDALGFKCTPQGAVLGWLKGVGDDRIDFGVENLENENVRRFVNGHDDWLLLTFNHNGIIINDI